MTPHSQEASGMLSIFVIHDGVLTADILWAMNTVLSDYSVSSSERAAGRTNRLTSKVFGQ